MAANPHPVDIYVGSRVRLRRTLLGLSQQKLGQELGLTFQQIQKYERGANRIGSSRIFQISQILDVPVSFFFDGAENASAEKARGFSESEGAVFESEQLAKRETLELVRAYYRIEHDAVRKKIFELVKAVSPKVQTKGGKRLGRPPNKAQKAS